MWESVLIMLPSPGLWLLMTNALITITALVAFGLTAPDFNGCDY